MNSMNIDEVCRGCPGAMMGYCDICRVTDNGDELTDREREDDYRELCADAERDEQSEDKE